MKFTEAYSTQRNHAKRRGVGFHLTYDEWIDFWGDKIDERGRGLGKLQMCRFKDEGDYELGNIYIDTHEENSKDKFRNGFKGKPRAITGESMNTVRAMLEMGVSTRNIGYLINCNQKQVMNFKKEIYG